MRDATNFPTNESDWLSKVNKERKFFAHNGDLIKKFKNLQIYCLFNVHTKQGVSKKGNQALECPTPSII